MKNNNRNILWTIASVLVVAVIGTAVYFGNTQTQKGSLNISLIKPVVLDSYFNFDKSPDGVGAPIPFFNVNFSSTMGNAYFQLLDGSNNVVEATPHSCVHIVPTGGGPSTKFTCQFAFLVGFPDATGYTNYSDAPRGKYKIRVFYGLKNYTQLTPEKIIAQNWIDSPLVGYEL